MKVAIVGIGHIAKHQANAIQQLADTIELVGAYDRDVSVAQKRTLPCHFHKSLDELIEKSPADIVVVSTTNHDHFATASRLLGAGRPVMVEKPVCEKTEELAELVRLAKNGNLFFHTAFHARFAPDLLWWAEHREMFAHRFGPIERFQMGFYDPYLDRDGTVKKNAIGLDGSWYDSGINALSVLALIADPASIAVTDGYMYSSPHVACDQINGSAQLKCLVDGNLCRGKIDTNWALALDRKTTMLSYKSGTILLDHSQEHVVIRDGKFTETVSLQNGLPRLTNHYIGVFQDLETAFVKQQDNIALSRQLHELLLSAVAQANGAPG